ncbi:MAG TPA: hypothetical protein VK453_27040 [Micromonosporaceae bacterium]|nr:hypothetical protein [Micromonosporaceae bacterium]
MFRADVDTLPEIADESVAALRQVSPDLTVVDRGELGDPADPGFVQQLRMTAVVNGAVWDVLQSQVYISTRAAGGQQAQTVVRAVLTCTVSQFSSMVGDFDEFLATLRFAPDS